MCGRLIAAGPWEEYLRWLEFLPVIKQDVTFHPNSNFTPAQDMNIITRAPSGEYCFVSANWGFVPHWARDARKFKPVINARSETVAQKPYFRDAFLNSRCLIIASGYYEWSRTTQGKQPYAFTLPNRQPLLFAGIYSINFHLNVTTFALITLSACEEVSPVHDRMPLLLGTEASQTWLGKTSDGESLSQCVKEHEGKKLVYWPVSSSVNRSRAQGEQLEPFLF